MKPKFGRNGKENSRRSFSLRGIGKGNSKIVPISIKIRKKPSEEKFKKPSRLFRKANIYHQKISPGIKGKPIKVDLQKTLNIYRAQLKEKEINRINKIWKSKTSAIHHQDKVSTKIKNEPKERLDSYSSVSSYFSHGIKELDHQIEESPPKMQKRKKMKKFRSQTTRYDSKPKSKIQRRHSFQLHTKSSENKMNSDLNEERIEDHIKRMYELSKNLRRKSENSQRKIELKRKEEEKNKPQWSKSFLKYNLKTKFGKQRRHSTTSTRKIPKIHSTKLYTVDQILNKEIEISSHTNKPTEKNLNAYGTTQLAIGNKIAVDLCLLEFEVSKKLKLLSSLRTDLDKDMMIEEFISIFNFFVDQIIKIKKKFGFSDPNDVNGEEKCVFHLLKFMKIHFSMFEGKKEYENIMETTKMNQKRKEIIEKQKEENLKLQERIKIVQKENQRLRKSLKIKESREEQIVNEINQKDKKMKNLKLKTTQLKKKIENQKKEEKIDNNKTKKYGKKKKKNERNEILKKLERIEDLVGLEKQEIQIRTEKLHEERKKEEQRLERKKRNSINAFFKESFQSEEKKNDEFQLEENKQEESKKEEEVDIPLHSILAKRVKEKEIARIQKKLNSEKEEEKEDFGRSKMNYGEHRRFFEESDEIKRRNENTGKPKNEEEERVLMFDDSDSENLPFTLDNDERNYPFYLLKKTMGV